MTPWTEVDKKTGRPPEPDKLDWRDKQILILALGRLDNLMSLLGKTYWEVGDIAINKSEIKELAKRLGAKLD